MILKSILLASMAATALAAAPAAAAPLQLTNAVYKEVEVKTADGKIERKLGPAATVAPGDEVLYVLSYANTGATAAEKVVIVNPLPADVAYVAPGEGAVPDVSVDAGKTFDALTRLTVAAADGAQRPAAPADVTHVRWTFAEPITAGSEGKVSYRAKLK